MLTLQVPHIGNSNPPPEDKCGSGGLVDLLPLSAMGD